MRFTGKSPSSKDKQIDVFDFKIGKTELFVLMDILSDVYIKTPRSLFTQPFTSRVNSMKTAIADMFRSEGIKYPVKRQDYKLGSKEVF